MPGFYESDVVIYTMMAGAKRTGIPVDSDRLEETVGVEAADELNDLLASLLADSGLKDAIEIIPEEAPPDTAKGFGLRFRTAREMGKPVLGKPVLMRFFQIREVWVQSLLAAVGSALALYAASPSAGVSLATLARTVWTGLITLRRPADALQLDTYDALLVAIARKRQLGEDATCLSAIEIHGSSENKSLEVTVEGLRRLQALKLVEVASWAEASQDYNNPKNCWRASF